MDENLTRRDALKVGAVALGATAEARADEDEGDRAKVNANVGPHFILGWYNTLRIHGPKFDPKTKYVVELKGNHPLGQIGWVPNPASATVEVVDVGGTTKTCLTIRVKPEKLGKWRDESDYDRGIADLTVTVTTQPSKGDKRGKPVAGPTKHEHVSYVELMA